MATWNPSGWKLAIGLGLSVPALVGAAMLPGVAAGKDRPAKHDHSTHDHMPEGLKDDLAQVRRATAKFHRVDAAIAAGYELGWVSGVNGTGPRIVFGCVTNLVNPAAGAMGYHYFNAELMADNDVDVRRPEVLVYASNAEGGRDLVAVEWVVRSADSNPPGVSVAPSVLGMEMHILVPKPGPAFYLKHAWLWRDNPSGMFADWNPDVRCP